MHVIRIIPVVNAPVLDAIKNNGLSTCTSMFQTYTELNLTTLLNPTQTGAVPAPARPDQLRCYHKYLLQPHPRQSGGAFWSQSSGRQGLRPECCAAEDFMCYYAHGLIRVF